jgi:hypothetical protein
LHRVSGRGGERNAGADPDPPVQLHGAALGPRGHQILLWKQHHHPLADRDHVGAKRNFSRSHFAKFSAINITEALSKNKKMLS